MIGDVLKIWWKADALITFLDGTTAVINMVDISFEGLVEAKEEIVKEYSLTAKTIKFMATRKEVVYKMELTIDEEVEL